MSNLLALSTGAIVGIAVGAVALLAIIIIIWGIAVYNKLIKSGVGIDEAFSTMDVYLNKRYDLIPNLVETCKGYAKHESETLENVMRARNLAMKSNGEKDRFEKENALTGTLRRLYKVTENYPNLKADTHFTKLMNELSRIEDEITQSRKYYNGCVKEYNIMRRVFPKNLIAKMFGFKERALFEVEDAEVRKNVKVKF